MREHALSHLSLSLALSCSPAESDTDGQNLKRAHAFRGVRGVGLPRATRVDATRYLH